MKFTKITSLMIALVMVISLAGIGSNIISAEEPEVVIDMATGLDLMYDTAERFKAEVESLSDGEIKVNIYTMDVLGDVVEQTRMGELDMAHTASNYIIPFMPEDQALNFPFLFESHEVAWEFANDPEFVEYFRDYMYEASDGELYFMSMMENGFRHLYNTKGPIRVPSDLAEHGVKMRTMEVPMHVAIWEALGAPAVLTLGAEERYSALETGMIDGTEGGLDSAWDSGLMEVHEYVTLTGHMYDYHYLVANVDWFEELSNEHQTIINTAMEILKTTQHVLASERQLEALGKMAEKGIQISSLTAEESEKWREIAEPIAREFLLEEIDEEFLEEVFDAVERARERVNRRYVTP